MSEAYIAGLRGEVREFETFFRRACVLRGRTTGSSSVYCIIRENEINVYANNPSQIRSFCTFTQSHFDGGITVNSGHRVDTVVSPPQVLKFLNKFNARDFVELRFADVEYASQPNVPEARRIQVRQQVAKSFQCSPVEDKFRDLRNELCSRFTGENVFLDEDKNQESPVRISLPVEELKEYHSLIEDNIEEWTAKGHHNSLIAAFPLVIQDGDIRVSLAVGNIAKGPSAWGQLKTYSINGPDIANHYDMNIGKIFKLFDAGTVDLYTDSQEGTLGIVHDGEKGAVYRYVISSRDIDMEDSIFAESEPSERID